MKKDIEWLKKEIEEYLEYEGVRDARIALESVLGHIDQLEEPEKVVIPQFVADWIDAYNLYGNNPLREYIDLESDFNEGWTDEEDATVYHWINKNPYAFIVALRYGYEVEKEKNYRVVFPYKGETVYLKESAHGDFDVIETETYGTQYTEAEIKAIDGRYWAFAEEVTK